MGRDRSGGGGQSILEVQESGNKAAAAASMAMRNKFSSAVHASHRASHLLSSAEHVLPPLLPSSSHNLCTAPPHHVPVLAPTKPLNPQPSTLKPRP